MAREKITITKDFDKAEKSQKAWRFSPSAIVYVLK